MKTEKIRVTQTVLCCDRCGKHDAPGGAVVVTSVLLQSIAPNRQPVIDAKGDLCANCIKVVAARFVRQSRPRKGKGVADGN